MSRTSVRKRARQRRYRWFLYDGEKRVSAFGHFMTKGQLEAYMRRNNLSSEKYTSKRELISAV